MLLIINQSFKQKKISPEFDLYLIFFLAPQLNRNLFFSRKKKSVLHLYEIYLIALD